MCEENIAKRGCDFCNACMILKKKRRNGERSTRPLYVQLKRNKLLVDDVILKYLRTIDTVYTYI